MPLSFIEYEINNFIIPIFFFQISNNYINWDKMND